MKNLVPKNFTKEIKQKEKKAHLFHESKIQWEIPKFEEIELESGFRPGGIELRTYRS